MMSRETINSWKHLGVLEALPFRVWIGPDCSSNLKYSRDGKPSFTVEWRSLDLKSGEISEILSRMPHGTCEMGTTDCLRQSRLRPWGLGGGRDPYRGLSILQNSVFYFDCASPGCEWKEAPPMLVPREDPSAVATGGKIYVFGSTRFDRGYFAEVFDIHQNRWDELPAPPVDSCLYPESVSHPVLFDSSRSRILVHFESNRSLYAFHPGDGSSECIDLEFGFCFGESNRSLIREIRENISEYITLFIRNGYPSFGIPIFHYLLINLLICFIWIMASFA